MGRIHFLTVFICTVGSGFGGALWSLRKFKQNGCLTPADILKKTWLVSFVAFLPLGVLPVHYVLAAKPDWQWDLPDWVQLHYYTLIWGIVLSAIACVFGFAIATYLFIRHPHRWFILVAGCFFLGLILLIPSMFSLEDRLPELLAHQLSKDGVILQSTSSTCVPAAMANILSVLGKKTTEKELAELFGTTMDGTLPAQVVKGMRHLRIETRKRTVASDSIRSITAPALLFMASDTHVVAFMGMTNQLAEIWDPGLGKKWVRPELLRESWSGHTLEFFQPPAP
jgi:hypothetical protein